MLLRAPTAGIEAVLGLIDIIDRPSALRPNIC
jgi:hypothetical protein